MDSTDDANNSLMVLDTCDPLVDYALDLCELSGKTFAVDTELNSIRVQLKELGKEIVTVEGSGINVLLQFVSDSFSDHDEPPTTADWEQFAASGISRVNLIHTISTKLTPKKIKSLDVAVNIGRIKIFNIIRSVTGSIFKITALVSDIRNYSRFCCLFAKTTISENLESCVMELASKIATLEQVMQTNLRAFYGFSAYLLVHLK